MTYNQSSWGNPSVHRPLFCHSTKEGKGPVMYLNSHLLFMCHWSQLTRSHGTLDPRKKAKVKVCTLCTCAVVISCL